MQTQKNSAKIILIRHAQSQFNLVQEQYIEELAKQKNLNLAGGIQDDPAYQSIELKFAPEYIDCPITEKLGLLQSEQAGQNLTNEDIGLVICSPLRRCLDTTYHIFKNHPNKPKIVVYPGVREYCESNCDIGGGFYKSMEQYPEFDWNYFKNYKHPGIWFIYEMFNKKIRERLLTQIFEKYNDDSNQINQQGQYDLLELMKQIYPDQIEGYSLLNERVQFVKKDLANVIKEHWIDQTKKIALVSHSRFIYHFLGEEYDEKGEPIGVKWFQNAEAREIEYFFNQEENSQIKYNNES